MNNDSKLIFEAYVDNLTKTKQALGQNIMRMVKHGMPGEKEIPELKQELSNIFSRAKKVNNKFTPEQESRAKELIAKLRNFGIAENDLRDIYRNAPAENAEGGVHPDEKKYGEMMKAHQDAEYKFRDWLNKQRAEGKARNYPQKAPYEVKPHWRKKEENAEMPTKQFMSLKQFINKGPVQVKKPTKELPYTHKYINQLAKQDPREGQREENAEKRVYDDVEVAFNLNGREYIAYGDVHFGEEGIHGKGEDTVENFVVLDAQTRQEIKDSAVLKHGYNAVYNAGVNQSAEENEERRFDPKCWKGYHKQGTKLKDGKRVNNCVKNS